MYYEDMASDSYNECGLMCTLFYPTVELYKAQFTCLLNYQKKTTIDEHEQIYCFSNTLV